MHSVSSENERDYEMITSIQQKVIFDKITPSKSTGEILNGLMQELNQLKAELTGKKILHFQEKFKLIIKLSSQISVAVSMTTTREMSRSGSAGGKKRILLGRAPRRRRRDDIPLIRLSISGWFFFCKDF